MIFGHFQGQVGVKANGVFPGIINHCEHVQYLWYLGIIISTYDQAGVGNISAITQFVEHFDI